MTGRAGSFKGPPPLHTEFRRVVNSFECMEHMHQAYYMHGWRDRTSHNICTRDLIS